MLLSIALTSWTWCSVKLEFITPDSANCVSFVKLRSPAVCDADACGWHALRCFGCGFMYFARGGNVGGRGRVDLGGNRVGRSAMPVAPLQKRFGSGLAASRCARGA